MDVHKFIEMPLMVRLQDWLRCKDEKAERMKISIGIFADGQGKTRVLTCRKCIFYCNCTTTRIILIYYNL